MNIDPAMPTLTLGLSEWQVLSGYAYRNWLPIEVAAAETCRTHGSVYGLDPGGEWMEFDCNGIEDGIRKADVLLREWIERVPQ